MVSACPIPEFELISSFPKDGIVLFAHNQAVSCANRDKGWFDIAKVEGNV
jgi:hypothetical protein